MALNFPLIVMDGKAYRVRVVYPSLSREFELLEGPNASTMLSGRNERDLLGTGRCGRNRRRRLPSRRRSPPRCRWCCSARPPCR